MEKTTKVLLIILFLIFSVGMGGCTSAQKTHSTPVTKEVPNITKKMYLKGGRIIECDMVWEGMASQILCKKSADIVAYSSGDVDLIRTFGENSAAEIAKRYEERAKQRELKSRAETPTITLKQARRMRKQRLERERKRDQEREAELKAEGISEESIRVEKRRLEDRLTHAEYADEAQIIKEKIEELERDPALYFSKKRHQQQLDCYKECRETYSESYCAERCKPSSSFETTVIIYE